MQQPEVKLRLSVSGASQVASETAKAAASVGELSAQAAKASPSVGKLKDAVAGIGAEVPGITGASGKMKDAIAGVGATAQISAKQTAAAMRMLPAQMTDVATQLAGGANPLLVLLQQGGQVKDSFGGFGPMFRTFASAVTPARLAIGGLVGVVAGFAAASVAGWMESKRLADGFALSGNMAGKSAGQINAQAAALANATNTAKGDVRDLLAALAASGQQTAETFDASARAALALAKVNGKAAAENVAAFDGMGESATAWALRSNKAYHFMTAAIFEQMKALEDQGRNSEAARIGLEALAGTLEQRTAPALGLIERSLKSAANWWSEMWDKAKGIGRVETIEDQLTKARAALDAAQTGIYSRDKVPERQAAVDALTRQKAADDLRRANRAGDQKAEEDTIARRQALATLTDKLSGVNSGFSKSLRTLSETYQAGEISGDRYRAMVAKLIETEGSGKEISDKARAAAEANIAFLVAGQRNAAEATLRQQDALQAALDNRRALGIVSEREFAQQSAQIAADRLAVERRLIEQQIEAERRKPVAANDPAAAIQKQVVVRQLQGQLAALNDKAAQNPILLQFKLGEIDAAKFAKIREGIAKVATAAFNDQAQGLDTIRASTAAAYQQAFVLEKGQEAWDRYAVATMRSEAALLAWDAANQGGDAMLEARARALSNLADMQERLNGLQLKQKLDGLDASSLQAFAAAAEESLGRVGKAFGGLMTTLDEYGRKQEELAKLRAAIPANDFAAQDRLARQSAQAQIKSYGDMASAAKNFFKEGSKGYKTLETAEKAFRLFEVGMAAKSAAEKMGFITAETAAKVAGNELQTESLLSSAVKQIAAFFGIGQASATAGIANQAAGDPYTAWARMAAMAAVMAGLGYVVSGGRGGGGGMTAKQRQEQNGTGTVLGDATAKSQSISKSIDRLAESSEIGLTYQSGMLDALRNIENALAGVSTQVLRAGGINTGKNLGITTGTLAKNKGDPILGLLGINDSALVEGMGPLGKVLGTLQGLWGKTKQEITDAGLQIGGTVGDLQQGKGVQQFADVATTKSSWFGLSKSTSNSTVTGAVDESLAKQFGLVFQGIGDALQFAAGALGKDGKAVADALSGFVVDIGKVSLKDLKGDELQEALATAIGAQADKIAAALLPGLDAFQQVGEGYFETLVRVASGVESAQYQLDLLGVAAVSFTDIQRKQGDVGAELVRTSIVQAETVGGAVSNVGKIIDTLDGSVTDLAGAYRQLVDVRYQFKAAGLGGEALTESAIRTGGGLSELGQSLDAYLSGFFSDQERTAAGMSKLGDQLRALGIDTVPATRDGFRALIESLDPSIEAEARLQVQLITLSGSFAELVPAADAAARSLADIAAEKDNLETRLLQLQGNTAELRRRELEKIDPSNRALQQQVWDLEDQQAAAGRGWSDVGAAASASAAQAVNAWASVWSSISDEIKRLRGNVAGNGPTNIARLQAQFASDSASARAGNAEAGKRLPELSKQIADIAEKTAGTREDFNLVQARLASSLEQTLVASSAPAEVMQGLRVDVQTMRDELVDALAQVAALNNKAWRIFDQWNADGMPAVRT